jgi:hypothetical protein
VGAIEESGEVFPLLEYFNIPKRQLYERKNSVEHQFTCLISICNLKKNKTLKRRKKGKYGKGQNFISIYFYINERAKDGEALRYNTHALYQELAVFGKMKMDPAKRAQTQNAGEVALLQWFFSQSVELMTDKVWLHCIRPMFLK